MSSQSFKLVAAVPATHTPWHIMRTFFDADGLRCHEHWAEFHSTRAAENAALVYAMITQPAEQLANFLKDPDGDH